MSKQNDLINEISEEINEEIPVMQEAKNAERQYFLKDDHEDVTDFPAHSSSQEAFNHYYKLNPQVKQKPELREQNILLSVRHLKQFFFFGKGPNRQKLKAVSNVSFDLKEGECLGIVGESGCGKTTTGRCIMRLYNITSGSIYYRGVRISAGKRWNEKEIKWAPVHAKEREEKILQKAKDDIASLDSTRTDFEAKSREINEAAQKEIRELQERVAMVRPTQKAKIKQIKFDNDHVSRKLLNEIQMIFQDPIDSLDPRMTVEDIIQEGLKIQGFHNKEENHKKVVEMLKTVGLVEEHASRYPHRGRGVLG